MPRPKKQRRQGPRRQYRGPYIARPPRALPVPARVNRTLKFNKTSFFLQAGFQFSNIRFNPTFAYDIDPTIGSSAMPFFGELGLMYRYYRVNWFRAKVKFSNKDNAPKTVYLCPTNFDPTVNLATFQTLLSQKVCVSKVVGRVDGASCGQLVSFSSIQQLGGAANPLIPDAYTGRCDGTGGSPANSMFIALGASSDAAEVSGTTYSLDILINLDFFELTTPAT